MACCGKCGNQLHACICWDTPQVYDEIIDEDDEMSLCPECGTETPVENIENNLRCPQCEYKND